MATSATYVLFVIMDIDTYLYYDFTCEPMCYTICMMTWEGFSSPVFIQLQCSFHVCFLLNVCFWWSPSQTCFLVHYNRDYFNGWTAMTARTVASMACLWSISCTKKDPVSCKNDEVIKGKHFPRYWPFVRGIHRPPVNSPHRGQWRGALIFDLCLWCV